MSTGRCDPPNNVINGTLMYTNNDTSNVFIGDSITYSCEVGSELVGPGERYCQRNETWSGPEPQCSMGMWNKTEACSYKNLIVALPVHNRTLLENFIKFHLGV